MAQTNISIRIDEDVKKEAEILCDKIGLTMSAITNVFYRQFVRTQGIPFPITAIDIDIETPKMARKQLKKAFKAAQEQSVINGTDDMSMDEINDIITECRHEMSNEQ